MSEYESPRGEITIRVPQQQPYSTGTAMTVLDIKRQVNQLHEVMTEVMVEGLHYGHIPGTPDGQMALYKEGAEKLGLTFRLAARFPKDRQETRELEKGHREYVSFCEIRHIPTGEVWAEIERSCSTKESKYRWRKQARNCPGCGAEAIIKDQYGGGWICWKKNGGCGVKFRDGDAAIDRQEVGKVENPDIADLYNTCLGMAQKRSHVAAMKLALACSDIFKQNAYEGLEGIEVNEVFGAVSVELEDDVPSPLSPPAKLYPAEKGKPLKMAKKDDYDQIPKQASPALVQALEDAKITPGALKIYLHNTFQVTELSALPADKEEEVYRWLAKTL